MRTKTFRTSINGDVWKYRLLSKERFEELHGDRCVAVTDKSTKTIDFREDHAKFNIVVHELTHAYMHYLFLGSTHNLTLSDFEEIVCELMEERILRIVDQSLAITRKMQEALENDKRRVSKISQRVLPANDGSDQAKEC